MSYLFSNNTNIIFFSSVPTSSNTVSYERKSMGYFGVLLVLMEVMIANIFLYFLEGEGGGHSLNQISLYYERHAEIDGLFQTA